jgi:hypothetical protein
VATIAGGFVASMLCNCCSDGVGFSSETWVWLPKGDREITSKLVVVFWVSDRWTVAEEGEEVCSDPPTITEMVIFRVWRA